MSAHDARDESDCDSVLLIDKVGFECIKPMGHSGDHECETMGAVERRTQFVTVQWWPS